MMVFFGKYVSFELEIKRARGLMEFDDSGPFRHN